MAKFPIGFTGLLPFTDGEIAFYGVSGFASKSATEANVQVEVRGTYTASNLRTHISFKNGANQTITLETNGTTDTQSLSITGTGWFEDTSNTDSLVAGDLICTTNDGGNGMHGDDINIFGQTMMLSGSAPTIALCYPFSSVNASYLSFWSSLFSGTESDFQVELQSSHVFSDLRVYCSAHTSNRTVTVRKNAANTSLATTVTGVGEFTDFSNTASFTSGDKYATLVSANTATISSFTLESDSGATLVGGLTLANRYAGAWGAAVATEAYTHIEAEESVNVQNLAVNCRQFSSTATVRSRDTGANGQMSVSVTGTGFFSDTSNTDALTTGDDFDFDLGGVSGQFIQAFAEWGTPSGGGGITGTVTASLPSLVAASTGVMQPSGTVTATLPSLTASSAGIHKQTGTSTTTLPSLTSSSSGWMNPEGTSTTTLPSLTASAIGEQKMFGTSATTLPSLTAASAGIHKQEGTVTASLPSLVASATGVMHPEGTVTATLPSLTASAAGTQTQSGTAAVTLPSLTCSATGTTAGVQGVATVILPSLTASATGVMQPEGTSAVTLPSLTASSSGIHKQEGAVTASLPSLTASGSGWAEATGTVTATLPSLTASSSGTQAQSGSAAAALPSLTSSATGAVKNIGTITATLPSLTATADGWHTVFGTVTAILPSIGGNATGALGGASSGRGIYKWTGMRSTRG